MLHLIKFDIDVDWVFNTPKILVDVEFELSNLKPEDVDKLRIDVLST